MSFFPEPEQLTFHRFGDFSMDLRDRIIDAALPSEGEVHLYRKRLLSISRWYKSCGRKSIAKLATVNKQWQDKVERLLFRELKVNAEDLADFERTCGTGPRTLLVQLLHIDINFLGLLTKNFPDFRLHQLEQIDFGAYDYDNDKPTPEQTEVAEYMLTRVFTILGRWDRSALRDSHLLHLNMSTWPLRNLCLDFSSLPRLSAIGVFTIHSSAWSASLHPSTSLSLIQKMPRLFHTSINLLGQNLAVASGANAQSSGPGAFLDSARILQMLPVNLTRLRLHAVSGVHFVTKKDWNAIKAAQAPSIPISIAECGDTMSMITHLEIVAVANIRFFFHRLAEAGPRSNGESKSWPNLRILKIWRCFAGSKLIPGALNQADQRVHQDRLINELLASIPQSLSQMPRLEELLLEIRTPDAEEDPSFDTEGSLSLTLLRFPELYPDTTRLDPSHPDAAILQIRAAVPPDRNVMKKWKSCVLLAWSKPLLGYQGIYPRLGYGIGLPVDRKLYPWDDDQHKDGDEVRVPVILADSDSVYSDLQPYSDSSDSQSDSELSGDRESAAFEDEMRADRDDTGTETVGMFIKRKAGSLREMVGF